MSMLNHFKKRIESLEAENQAITAKIQEMETDIKNMGDAVLDTTNELGIDALGGDFEKMNISSLLMKLTPKILSGKLKFEKLGLALPTLKKYEHLFKTNG